MINLCSHPGFLGSLCIKCGKFVDDDDDDSGVPFGYIHKNLSLSNDEIARLRSKDMKYSLHDKKLYLVLDLDHTLLNSTHLKKMTPDEKYLIARANSPKGSLFTLESIPRLTKLRPYVHTFLKEASEMFEMYIYTMGGHLYALESVKLLDPKSEYFISRVISRDESIHKHEKDLDLVLGEKSAILILDDRERVWPNCKENLILIERYNFFASSCRKCGINFKSLSESRSDESESDGALATVLKILRQIYHKFFNELGDDFDGRDVRQLLKTLRKEVLKNCKVVFSRDVSENFPCAHYHLWDMARQLGASCFTKVTESVTHVISTDIRAGESCWAVKENKFLVHPRWIETSYYSWKKQPEENFPSTYCKEPIVNEFHMIDKFLLHYRGLP